VLDLAFAAVVAITAAVMADVVGGLQLPEDAAAFDTGDHGIAVRAGEPFAFNRHALAAGVLVADRRRVTFAPVASVLELERDRQVIGLRLEPVRLDDRDVLGAG